jgi:prephenate dehydrogenase
VKMIERIAILGTGLLGTSVGLALRAAGFRGAIVGWNRSPEGGQTALAAGAIDALATDPLQAARESQVVLLALPIYATLDFIEKLAGVLGPGQLVTDVGSTKAQIAAAAGRLFNAPNRAAFLPGHPMAGKERGGAALGDAELFRGAVWLFTDDPAWQRSPDSAALVKGWREWVAAMGAKTLDLEAVRHDELVAWVSHLPQFVATALSALLEEQVGDAPELKDVVGEEPDRAPRPRTAAGPPARKPAYPGVARRVRTGKPLSARVQAGFWKRASVRPALCEYTASAAPRPRPLESPESAVKFRYNQPYER